MNNWPLHGGWTILLALLGAICPFASAGPPTIAPDARLLADAALIRTTWSGSSSTPAVVVHVFLASSWRDDPIDARLPLGPPGRNVPLSWGELANSLTGAALTDTKALKTDSPHEARSLMAQFLARHSGATHAASGVFLSPACHRHRQGGYGYAAASSTHTLIAAANLEHGAGAVESRAGVLPIGTAGIDGLRAIDCYLLWIDPVTGGTLKGV